MSGQWTFADLRALPDDGNRYEVIDGELFVTPSPTWRHQEAIGRLYRLISDYLDRHRVGHVFFAPADVVFSTNRGVQPDLFVVPLVDGRRPEAFDEVKRLLLAVEVLSVTSARADRVVKRTLYRDEGVAEYWVIDLDARTIERAVPDEPRVEVLAERLEWSPEGASESLRVDLIAFFAGLRTAQ